MKIYRYQNENERLSTRLVAVRAWVEWHTDVTGHPDVLGITEIVDHKGNLHVISQKELAPMTQVQLCKLWDLFNEDQVAFMVRGNVVPYADQDGPYTEPVSA